jgi:hypothetical protein
MTLRGDDGSKLAFERLPETRAKRDVYGRIIPEKKSSTSGNAKGDKPTDDTNKPPEENPPPDKKDEKPPEDG